MNNMRLKLFAAVLSAGLLVVSFQSCSAFKQGGSSRVAVPSASGVSGNGQGYGGARNATGTYVNIDTDGQCSTPGSTDYFPRAAMQLVEGSGQIIASDCQTANTSVSATDISYTSNNTKYLIYQNHLYQRQDTFSLDEQIASSATATWLCHGKGPDRVNANHFISTDAILFDAVSQSTLSVLLQDTSTGQLIENREADNLPLTMIIDSSTSQRNYSYQNTSGDTSVPSFLTLGIVPSSGTSYTGFLSFLWADLDPQTLDSVNCYRP